MTYLNSAPDSQNERGSARPAAPRVTLDRARPRRLLASSGVGIAGKCTVVSATLDPAGERVRTPSSRMVAKTTVTEGASLRDGPSPRSPSDRER